MLTSFGFLLAEILLHLRIVTTSLVHVCSANPLIILHIALRKNPVKCCHTLTHLAHDGVGFAATMSVMFVVITHAQLSEIGRKRAGSLQSYLRHPEV